MYTTAPQCYASSTTLYANGDSLYSDTVVPIQHMPFYQHSNQWDTLPLPESRFCLDSLKHRLARAGPACSPSRDLLSILQNEDALRVTGAKSLNALFRQVSVSPSEVSAVKLLKRRLRKRLAKRGWDSKERTRDQSERTSLIQLEEERERLRTEQEQLIREIQHLETLLKQ